MKLLRILALGGGLLAASGAAAHPLAPALLELRESERGVYAVHWRTAQATSGVRELRPQFPAHCAQRGEGRAEMQGPAFDARWMLDCRPGGLAGASLRIAGLERSAINLILRVEDAQGGVVQALLDARQAEFVVPPAAARPAVWRSYLALGVEHLLSGFDHLLFVAGLVLLLRRPRTLLAAVTAFTLGHSLTLSLAVLGKSPLSGAAAELGIALSILWLATELARPPAASPAALWRRPALMAAGFGLLHGLGFAGALRETGLPAGEIPLALLSFNLGIELGQLAVVLLLLALGAAWRRIPVRRGLARFTRALPAYGIGALAGYWCLQRLAMLGL